MFATNLCECFSILIKETMMDIWFSSNNGQTKVVFNSNITKYQENYLSPQTFNLIKKFYDSEQLCLQSNGIMKSILMRSGPYLSTCTMEYNILCISILMVMWKDNCFRDYGTGKLNCSQYGTISRCNT